MNEHAIGPRLAAHPVELVFLVDVSGSMSADAKIQSVNGGMEEALPFLRESATTMVGVAPRVRVATFGSDAAWVGSNPVPIEEFWWPELRAEPGGLTETGRALALVTTALPAAAPLPPALVLLSDGMPTDTGEPTYASALAALDRHPIGGASSRTAVAIGRDAHEPSLAAFVASAGGEVLDGGATHQLPGVLRLAGTSVLARASRPLT